MEAHGADLTGIAIVLAGALMAGIALQSLRQPPIVGYILAGVLLGPSGVKLVSRSEEVSTLAELGVVLLLFLVGMELSLKAFVRVLRPSALVAAGQIAASLAITFGFGWYLGWRIEQSLLLGFVIALSSTAIAMKMLEDIDELRSETGQITIGVLIAQDIAVVPILILVDSLGGAGDRGLTFGTSIKIAVAIGLLAGFVYVLSHRAKIALPFDEAVRGKVDLLTLATLAVCFVAASISGLIGLSPAYGAFVAGLLIASSRIRSEAIRVTEPVQSVLLVVFFLSIGLLIDVRYIWANLGTVLLFVGGVVAIKTVLNVILLRLVGQPWQRAFPSALIMAQIGEFSFVLAAVGYGNRVISPEGYKLAMSVIATSLLISPFWMRSIRRFDDAVARGILSLREALAEVYAKELAELERGAALLDRALIATKQRGRALRLAWTRRGSRRPPETQVAESDRVETAKSSDEPTEARRAPDSAGPDSGRPER